ncbi:helix-turn-helix domain-containing protein [Vibrio owensii]|uniref:helix-turn-helix domain-containing protein n=1 Tax=Vibrio owensii TaxID=696485 RepID=UPI00148D58F3|nr:helix-turn-helix domain-containing protein [Vibrio owensii]NOI69392.1 helix-turn-helix domain-containing protein [Vibrio owensii]
MNKETFWTIDKKKRSLYGENGIDIHFTKYEFNLFYYLIHSQGEVRSSDSIIDEVWGNANEGNYRPDSSNLIQLISKTRRQLKPLEQIMEIKSQRGVGYYLTLNDGYDFNDDEITYAANSIYDRDPESEKKYRFFQSQFLKELFSINENREFRVRDLGFVFLLSVFFVGIMLSRNALHYPKLPLEIDSSPLLLDRCNIDANVIFTSEEIACTEISNFDFDKKGSYIISKVKGDIYVASL